MRPHRPIIMGTFTRGAQRWSLLWSGSSWEWKGEDCAGHPYPDADQLRKALAAAWFKDMPVTVELVPDLPPMPCMYGGAGTGEFMSSIAVSHMSWDAQMR